MRRYEVFRWSSVWLVAAMVAGCGGDDGQSTGNRPPAIDELSAEAQTVAPGSETAVDLRTSDPDGSSDLNYRWTIDEGGWSIEGSESLATVTAPDRYGSRAEVGIAVSDGTSTTRSSIELSTGSNRAPQIAGVDVSPRPVPIGGSATVEARVSDPRGDELTHRWSAPGSWSLESTTGPSVELTAPERSDVQAQLELVVDDGHGGAIERNIPVQTAVNRSPQITTVSASPPQLAPGGRTEAQVEASDPNGDDLEYEWSAPNSWTVENSGPRVDIRAPDQNGASAEIAVEVTDGHGGSDTGRVVIGVTTNTGPRIHGLSAAPQTASRAGSVDLQVDASDPNGDSLGYDWTTSAAGWSLSESGDSARATAPDRPGSTARIDVTVTDSDGKTARASEVVATRPNRPPQVARIALSPAELPPSGEATARAVASDPEGDSLTYDWTPPSDWSLDGNGRKAQLTAPAEYGRRGMLRVEVSDGRGATTTAATAVATRANEPPSIASVDANPSTIDADGKTTLTVVASDPNGDSLSYTWSRPKGWAEIGGSGADLEVRGPGSYGESGRFEVTVSDGYGGQTRSAVMVQTRRNRPPQVASIQAPKTTVDRGRSIVLEVTARDPEGGNLSYTWNVPKPWGHQPLGGGDRARVTAPSKLAHYVTVEVTVTDPKGASSQAALRLHTPRTP